MLPSLPVTSKPHFGAIFIKRQMGITVDDSGRVINHVDGTVYPITSKELQDRYDPIPGSPNHFRSKPGQWKDIRLVLPGTRYDELVFDPKKQEETMVEKTAVSGILVRQNGGNGQCFYEISPYYAIGVYEPAPDDPEAKDLYTQILNIAHLQGPVKSLEALNHFAFKLLFINRPYVLSLAGYSNGPEEYDQLAQHALTEIIKVLGRGRVGLVTSPTANANSIDAVGTLLAQDFQIPLIYVTAEEYLQYIEPSRFPRNIQQALYAVTEKFFFKKPSDYSQATAWASNTCVVIGGRQTAVKDAIHALERGNKLIIVNDSKIGRPAWDLTKGEIDNASQYLVDQLRSFRETGTLRKDYGSIDGITSELLEVLKAHQPLDRNIKVINLGEKGRENEMKKQLKHLDAFIDGQAPLDV